MVWTIRGIIAICMECVEKGSWIFGDQAEDAWGGNYNKNGWHGGWRPAERRARGAPIMRATPRTRLCWDCHINSLS